MDFFGILFDIKNGSKMPYSKNYFDTLFAAKLEELGVKTLTGTLPLTFTTSETALRSWTIYGNNTAHSYSASGTLPLTFTSHTAGNAVDWEIRGNDDSINLFNKNDTNAQMAAIPVNGHIEGSSSSFPNVFMIFIPVEEGLEYTFKMNQPLPLTNTPLCSVFTTVTPVMGVSYRIDGVSTFQSETTGTTTFTRTAPAKAKYMCVEIAFESVLQNDIMLVQGSTAPDHFIPYQKGVGEQRQDGYYVPITISQTGQTDKTVDIFIGDTPLTEGETVSKLSTGIDIELFEGENTISTTLYNKPPMSIEGLDYVGVGRPRGQEWEIRLVCVGELSPYKPNAPESDTSYVYNATDYTLDTDSRYKTALIEIGKEHQKIFTIGKTKGETFTIQPLDYMAEWGGVDHYNQIGQTITPTEETYTGETAAQYLLVTYYDSEVDTLTPKEIRESITLTATVDANTIIPIDAPLTEGQSVSKESTGVDIETFQHANNTLMEYAIESSNIEMSITYKGG